MKTFVQTTLASMAALVLQTTMATRAHVLLTGPTPTARHVRTYNWGKSMIVKQNV